MERTEAQRDSRSISRRRFFRTLLGFSLTSTLTMIALPVIGFLVPPRQPAVGAGSRVLAGKLADIGIGRSKVIALGSAPVIVVNSPERGVKAFSAVCTHLGCIVGYDAASSVDIVSPCHDGHFSVVDGHVVSGPPPAPLAEYGVSVEEDEVFVLG